MKRRRQDPQPIDLLAYRRAMAEAEAKRQRQASEPLVRSWRRLLIAPGAGAALIAAFHILGRG